MTTTAPTGTGTTPPDDSGAASAVAEAAAVERRESVLVKPRRRRRIRWGSNIIAIVFSLVWIFPVYWMVNTAFKPQSEVMTPTPLFLPAHPTISNFVVAIGQTDFLVNLKNSVIVVVFAVVFSILLGLFASAALSRFQFRGRRSIMVFILIVQMLPSTALLIPLFLVFNAVGLLGTYAGLILAYVGSVLPFSIWVMRGFFLAIPLEVEEAARIDGATTWQVLTRVLFPLVMPGVIATGVFAFIAAWNDYLVAYVFMKDQSHYTLPLWLASFSTPTGGTDFGGQMAASVLFSLPVVVFFMIIQRNLVSGMSAGAVKG
ncbi:carbohydrate ABC transporter permease [Frondihabitans australicus]|uniref:N,N'-diacetylchitobiose transport system permease protein n=1 Tax=Frondihabitans australicus TaxID=386892 RepID=A0A495II30_9MICO|nr:carbohydrate ABC transporter permease [Frondihabitans australicus]RKR75429.1 N,N'-diacetylchitobiose transport system permease protein [Frondihabitans australicus]